jgi:hypothetical protein
LSTNSSCNRPDKIAGYGDTSSYLNKETGKVSDITAAWTATPFTAEGKGSASAWVTSLENLRFDTVDPRGAGLAENVNSEVGSIVDAQAVKANPAYKPDTTKPATDPCNQPTLPMTKKDGTTPVTLKDLNDGYTDTDGTKVPADHTALAYSLNTFKPAAGSAAVPEGFQETSNTVKSLGAAFSDQSKTVTTLISQMSSNDQATVNGLNKFLTSITDLEKNCTQNQKSS